MSELTTLKETYCNKLLFDITKQKLEISSFKNDKVKTNIKLNEKGFRILKFKKMLILR